MGRNLLRIVGLTLALGATVVASWAAVRGSSVLNGPGPWLDPSWYLVWGLQAGLAGIVGFVVGRAWGREISAVGLAVLSSLAWIGELVVVALLTPVLSDDLRLFQAPWVWLVATGGPIQPLSAFVGTLLGRASVRDGEAPADRTLA
jgi:hypothetical protein